MNEENVIKILSIDEVDGVLIGGASIDAGEFLNLINTVEHKEGEYI